MSTLRVTAISSLHAEFSVPGDKSMSHRAAILGGLSDGSCTLRNFLPSEDCINTLNAMRALGADVIEVGATYDVAVAACRQLEIIGLNRGTTGNISCREGDHFLVTPSGVPVDAMTEAGIVAMRFDGSVTGGGKPSSEWHFHRDILQQRPDVHAIVHTHSPYATALACLREDLPAFHYMIAIAGGDSIRCAPYTLFGTETLSQYALAALTDRKACLLANHGLIALGRDIAEAMAIATEVESLCQQYLIARQSGKPVLLSAEEMQQVIARFKTYGRHATPTE
jgi:L-fuculose-phosphate aldolase